MDYYIINGKVYHDHAFHDLTLHVRNGKLELCSQAPAGAEMVDAAAGKAIDIAKNITRVKQMAFRLNIFFIFATNPFCCATGRNKRDNSNVTDIKRNICFL